MQRISIVESMLPYLYIPYFHISLELWLCASSPRITGHAISPIANYSAYTRYSLSLILTTTFQSPLIAFDDIENMVIYISGKKKISLHRAHALCWIDHAADEIAVYRISPSSVKLPTAYAATPMHNTTSRHGATLAGVIIRRRFTFRRYRARSCRLWTADQYGQLTLLMTAYQLSPMTLTCKWRRIFYASLLEVNFSNIDMHATNHAFDGLYAVTQRRVTLISLHTVVTMHALARRSGSL